MATSTNGQEQHGQEQHELAPNNNQNQNENETPFVKSYRTCAEEGGMIANEKMIKTLKGFAADAAARPATVPARNHVIDVAAISAAVSTIHSVAVDAAKYAAAGAAFASNAAAAALKVAAGDVVTACENVDDAGKTAAEAAAAAAGAAAAACKDAANDALAACKIAADAGKTAAVAVTAADAEAATAADTGAAATGNAAVSMAVVVAAAAIGRAIDAAAAAADKVAAAATAAAAAATSAAAATGNAATAASNAHAAAVIDAAAASATGNAAADVARAAAAAHDVWRLPLMFFSIVVLLRRHNASNKICSGCNNDDASCLKVTKIDFYGFITEVCCTKCRRKMRTTCNEGRVNLERIQDINALKPGDHICWHRPFVIWHHAIVCNIEESPKRVWVIENIPKPGVIQHKFKEITLGIDTLYRVNHTDCYSDQYTIFRAGILLQDRRKNYNWKTNNCEHMSNFCKTGHSISKQVTSVKATACRLILMTLLRFPGAALLGLLGLAFDERETDTTSGMEITEKVITTILLACMTISIIFYIIREKCSAFAKAYDDDANAWDVESLAPLQKKTVCCRRCACSRVACGMAFRIIIRELCAFAGPCAIAWFADVIPWLKDSSCFLYALKFFAFTFAVSIIASIIGAFIGRAVEMCIAGSCTMAMVRHSVKLYCPRCRDRRGYDELREETET